MLGSDERRLALRALTDARPLDEVAAEAGVTTDELTRLIQAYLRDKASLGPAAVTTRVRRGAEIIRDRRGIPHIQADDPEDLFFALGYAQAQDRLWQLDYLRRVAHGTLSEVFGPETLESDVLARTLGIGRIAEEVVAGLAPESRLAVGAFSEGVNAWMAALPAGLPVEFELLGYEPAPWRPVDSLAVQRRWWWYLTGRLWVLYIPELVRAAVGDGERFDAFHTPDGEVRYIVPPGSYAPEPRWPVGRPAAPGRHPVAGVQDHVGSNNWAVAATRAAGDGALLASDPHVYFSVPTEWYEAHLTGAGFDVAGLAYPATPAFLFGRNERVAWGLTNNICSLRDLYLVPVDPERPGMYRRGDAWLPMRADEEVIPVRDGSAHHLVVQRTEHGPVVDHLVPPEARPPALWPGQPRGQSVLALRWVGQEVSDETQCMLDLDRAGTVDAARRALRGWRCPTFNFGIAERGGRVRYQCAGAIPLRGRAVAGYRDAEDPRDRWQGTIPDDGLPALDDPARGWVASANNTTAPPDFPYPLAGTWTPDDRAARIEDLLEDRARHTLDSVRRIQTDTRSGRGLRAAANLVDVLGNVTDEPARSALATLRAWDGHLTTESVAAAIANVVFWRFHLRVLGERFDVAVVPLVASAGAGLTGDLLRHDPHGWFASEEARVAAVRAAFAEALDWLAGSFGADVDGWTWGRLHRLGVRHPAARTPLQHRFLDVPDRPQAGGIGTIANAGFGWSDDFKTRIGANYRLLVDLAPGGETLTVSYPGQSGQPGSPHYADQVEPYLRGDYGRVPFSRAEVEDAAESRTRLAPGKTEDRPHGAPGDGAGRSSEPPE